VLGQIRTVSDSRLAAHTIAAPDVKEELWSDNAARLPLLMRPPGQAGNSSKRCMLRGSVQESADCTRIRGNAVRGRSEESDGWPREK
jgi:hypothetical protein